MNLAVQAMGKFIFGFILVGIVIFLPAGSLCYFGGWLLMCVLFLPMLILGTLLFVKAPELLKKRLSSNERQTTQKRVVILSAIVFVLGFVVSGLDFRFGWSKVPYGVMLVAALIFLFGYALYAEVMRENQYLSRTVEVQQGQKVISTGLYGLVRHPMYMATLLMFLMIPLILSSWYGLLIFLHYPIVIIIRIRSEEKLLQAELEGYKEYKNKVKYRLIPWIW